MQCRVKSLEVGYEKFTELCCSHRLSALKARTSHENSKKE